MLSTWNGLLSNSILFKFYRIGNRNTLRLHSEGNGRSGVIQECGNAQICNGQVECIRVVKEAFCQ